MYELYIERSVEKSFRKLERKTADRLIDIIKLLSENPRPRGCRKLTDHENDFRLRVGEYRIVYEIDESRKAVTILAAGHRRDIYRKK